jgi:pyruvate carboxylase
MRWSLRLSEFDFGVEHTSGSKVTHVDALSRHVPTVGGRTVLTKQLILEEECKDLFCGRQKQSRLTPRSEFFLYMDGLLYRRQSGKEHQLVVPQSLVQEVIAENHDPIFVAHPGSKRTFELISLRYWWPKMRQNIEDYVTRCDKCQTRKG